MVGHTNKPNPPNLLQIHQLQYLYTIWAKLVIHHLEKGKVKIQHMHAQHREIDFMQVEIASRF